MSGPGAIRAQQAGYTASPTVSTRVRNTVPYRFPAVMTDGYRPT